MAKNKILLYGATGFMGRMIAELAAAQELPLIIAGRSPDKLAKLDADLAKIAANNDVSYAAGACRAFPVETPEERALRLKQASEEGPRSASRTSKAAPPPPAVKRVIDAALSDVKVVLNAAGPFGATADSLARACIRTETHYLDICGEYDVFNGLRDLAGFAKKSALMPGVGLTVLCSDLLTGLAITEGQKVNMGEPHLVRVALSRVPFVSRGSAKTMLNSVRNGVLVNRFGQLQLVPIGQLTRSFAFGGEGAQGGAELQICTALTLADVRTAGVSASRVWRDLTGKGAITPSVETYVEASTLERLTYQVAGGFAFAFRSWPLKAALDGMLSLWPEGPPADERDSARQQVVVQVEDRYRRAVHVCLDLPNSYDFTARVALKVAARVQGSPGLAGFVTPGQVIPDVKAFFQKTRENAEAPAVSYKLSYHGFPGTDEALYEGRT